LPTDVLLWLFQATTEGPCLELPATLQQYKIVRSDLAELKDSPTVCDLLASFRDFCTVLWFLHTRDTLSLALRKRGTQLATDTQAGQVSLILYLKLFIIELLKSIE